jgi:hypothetical protein
MVVLQIIGLIFLFIAAVIIRAEIKDMLSSTVNKKKEK